jgi:hypothetical protein
MAGDVVEVKARTQAVKVRIVTALAEGTGDEEGVSMRRGAGQAQEKRAERRRVGGFAW